MKLLKALESRNHCLRKISETSENFLSKVTVSDLTELESFETWRNSAIKVLMFYDNHIERLTSQLLPNEKSEDLKSSVRNLLEIGKNLIYYISIIDRKIIEEIKTEKTYLLKVLAVAEQSKKTVSKFRSETALRPGGQLDGKI